MQRFPELMEKYRGWRCAACGEEMAPGPVSLEYMGNEFVVELPVCKTCGQVLVPEELALGKMHEVEQILEDK